MQNGGNFRGSMNVTDALATSPNTAFAKLIQQVGVPRAAQDADPGLGGVQGRTDRPPGSTLTSYTRNTPRESK